MSLTRWDRRHFLQDTGMILSGGILGVSGLPARTPSPPAASPVTYERLGLRPLINAKGTYTHLSGSLLPPEVAEAMREAARHYVSIPDLLEKSGVHLAHLLDCEAALVTSGAAGALTLGTAACVAGDDPEKARRLPDTLGMKNEVIIQKTHRFVYDHAVRNVGIRLVEVEDRQHLEASINVRTAMMLFLNAAEPKGPIHYEEWIELGKKYGVPTFIDCAADVPPAENLTRYTRMGFDLVTFSGGKALRGPQCSGLLLGRKDLIRAARVHNYPKADTLGRPCKVGKEEIMGLVAAVERYLKLDHAAEWRLWEQQIEQIDSQVGSVPGVETQPHVPAIANHVPHLKIRWPEEAWSFSRQDCLAALRAGEPPVEVGIGEDEALILNTFMLQPGEERIVAARLQQVLNQAQARVGNPV